MAAPNRARESTGTECAWGKAKSGKLKAEMEEGQREKRRIESEKRRLKT
jgi:hypothetical protein